MHFGILVVEDSQALLSRELKSWIDNHVNPILKGARESLEILSAGQCMSLEKFNPRVCIVHCDGKVGWKSGSPEDAAIQFAKKDGMPIFPVVDDLTRFDTLAPPELADFNAFQYTPADDISELSNLVLERMELLRSRRKVFISYARQESRAVAMQLYEQLTARWYRVFLDTHAIRPGVNFQESLMQELIDSDVMVLLDSPGIRSRPWVMEEIAFADKIGLGAIRVIWPKNRREVKEAEFFEPIRLDDSDFGEPDARTTARRLCPNVLNKIVKHVAEQRTEAYRIREQRMVNKVKEFAKQRPLVVHLGRYMVLDSRCRIEIALGLPDSYRIQRAIERRHADGKPCGQGNGTHLLYDPTSITDAMSDHLGFLESGLKKINLLSSQEVYKWIGTI